MWQLLWMRDLERKGSASALCSPIRLNLLGPPSGRHGSNLSILRITKINHWHWSWSQHPVSRLWRSLSEVTSPFSPCSEQPEHSEERIQDLRESRTIEMFLIVLFVWLRDLESYSPWRSPSLSTVINTEWMKRQGFTRNLDKVESGGKPPALQTL